MNATIVWLVGGYHPKAKISVPATGQTYSGTVNAAWSAMAFGGKTISKQSLYYSEDGGQTTAFLATVPPGTFTYAWDTTKANNSNNFCFKIAVEDSGTPAMAGSDNACKFTVNNAGSDTLGPIVIPGSIMISPNPAVNGTPFVVDAIIDDTYRGSSNIAAAEFHIDVPSPTPGTGTAMSAKDGSFNTPTETVTFSGPHNTAQGQHTLTIFGKDAAGNWGPKLDYIFNTNPKGVGLGSISGKVKDKSSGNGIPGAVLIAYDTGTKNQKGSAMSSGTGDYMIPLPAGTYDVNASATGYYSNQKNGIAVTAGNNTPGQDIELTGIPGQTPGSISGNVKGAGSNLQGAIVIAFEAGTSNNKGQATTDASGNYKITNLLPTIKYDVNASATGYFSKQQNGITVVSGQDTPNINFDLIKMAVNPGPISGKITSSGSPLAGATINAITGGTTKGSATSAVDGTYKITSLDPAVYRVNASKTGCTPKEQSNVAVNAGQDTPNINLDLVCQGGVDTGTIAGTVTDQSTSSPIGNVNVKLMQGATQKGTTTTGATDGKYTFASIAVGTYDLVFNKTNYNDKTVTGVVVTKDQTTTKDVQMVAKSTPGKATITGTVKDKSTKAVIASVTVTLVQGGTTKDTKYTGADGTYTFSNVDPGTYDLKFVKTGYNDKTETGVVATADQTTTKDVEMEAKGTVVPPPDNTMIIVAAVLAIVIVAVILLVVLMMRRKKAAPQYPPGYGSQPQYPPGYGPQQAGEYPPEYQQQGDYPPPPG